MRELERKASGSTNPLESPQAAITKEPLGICATIIERLTTLKKQRIEYSCIIMLLAELPKFGQNSGRAKIPFNGILLEKYEMY